jgi:hypothetical protein
VAVSLTTTRCARHVRLSSYTTSVDTSLNLGGWKLRCPLELSQCRLRCKLDMAKTELTNLNLQGSYRSGLSARRLHVSHTVNLRGARCDGPAVFRQAHITGALDCTEAVFTNPDGFSLNTEGLAVDADMVPRNAQCTGDVLLLDAHITGALDCTEAVLNNPDGTALNGDRVSVDAPMFLRNAQYTGEVRLLGAHITGALDCTEAVSSALQNDSGDRSRARRAAICTAACGPGANHTAELYLCGLKPMTASRMVGDHLPPRSHDRFTDLVAGPGIFGPLERRCRRCASQATGRRRGWRRSKRTSASGFVCGHDHGVRVARCVLRAHLARRPRMVTYHRVDVKTSITMQNDY